MEALLASAHQRKASKKTKLSKKKPIKVVYISNPMKVKTSASKFRALVQELTGQDAAGLHNPNKYIIDDTHDVVGGNNQTFLDASKIVGGDIDHHHHHHHHDDHRALEVPEQQQHETSDFSIGSFDDDLIPQILDYFPGLYCGSSQVNM